MTCQRIPIASLRVGMYVTGCDRPWIETPFLAHKFRVKAQSQIDKLRESGIRFVDVDPARGADCRDPEETAPPSVTGESEATRQSAPGESSNGLRLSPALDVGSLARGLSEARKAREHMLASVRSLLESVRMSGVLSVARITQVTEEVIARTLEHGQTLIALIRTRDFDPDLYDHALSVGTLTVVLGRLLGYDGKDLGNLAAGALLHDVGLLRLPRNLLRPLRPLSLPDRKVFAMHPQIGMELLRGSGDMPGEVLQMIAEHHEMPGVQQHADDPARSAVVRCSRLLQVVDAYDELLTGQGGRPALLPRVAIQQLYLEAQQNRLDLELTSHLISQIGVYPMFSFVELNTGHRGIVIRVAPAELLRPVVLLTHDPARILLENPMPVDLAVLTAEHRRLEIVSVLDPQMEKVEVEGLLSAWVVRQECPSETIDDSDARGPSRRRFERGLA